MDSSEMLSCNRADGGAPEPSPGPPVALQSISLYDVQGLWGGVVLRALEDRTALVQVVGTGPAGQRGLSTRRYLAQISAEQWAEVERLVGAHRFLTLQIPLRLGVPDEARPVISVTTADGATVEMAKWANDRCPGFDAVYDYLVGICRLGGAFVAEGPF